MLKGKKVVGKINSIQLDRGECLGPFKEWEGKSNKVAY